VDLYDDEAAAPVLDSLDFYRHCRELLSPQGCMTVNLFGRSSSYAESVAKISEAFGEDAIWAFKPTREGNAIVLAQRTPNRPSRDALAQAASAIQDKWGWPATKWLQVFKPLIR
jgi:spermidine synthase